MILTHAALTIIAFYVIKYIRNFITNRQAYFKLPNLSDFSYQTGNLHLYPGSNEEGLAFDLKQGEKYCYLYVFWLGPLIPVVVVFHPDSIRQIIKSSAPKPRWNFFASAYDMGLPWLGEGLILSNGARWARSRRLLTPAFHFDILKPYMEVYNDCVDILLEKLEQHSQQGKSFDITPLLSMHALDIILRCAFSYKSDCQTEGCHNGYASVIQQLQSMWIYRSISSSIVHHIEFLYRLTSHGKNFYKLCDMAHKTTEEIIDKRKQELKSNPDLISRKKCKDFLDILLTAKDKDGQGLSLLEIRNEVDTFFFAGHDTTSIAMTWTLYALAGHPECQEKVYREVTDVLNEKVHIEWSDLQKLEFTTMCIKESLRLHGVVPGIQRMTTEEVNVHGQIIPAGTNVAFHLWVLHHNPHVWEDPLEFKPERFHPDKVKDMDTFQFLPFSAGPRNCIGQNFAMNEMKTTISRIIKNFKLSVDPSCKPRKCVFLTLSPEDGVYLNFTPR